jgi:thiopeptide-type bacteriocin biosynthesis protein
MEQSQNSEKRVVYPGDFLTDLFLRTPLFSYADYALSRLPEILKLRVFRDALQLASPVFFALLDKKNFDFAQLSDKEIHTLTKYYNRLCFRPTPFGHFAGFTLLEWGDQGPVQLAGIDDCWSHRLPDNATRIYAPEGVLIVNPTLYRLGRAWRYYRFSIGDQRPARFSLDELDAVRFNNELLRLFRSGPQNKNRVLEWIADYSGCTIDAAADYLDFLIDEQVLYPPAQGTMISTKNPFSYRLADLETWNKEMVYYAALERPLVKGSLPVADREELAGAISFLRQLAPAPVNPDLQKFIAAFTARFDQEKVPLLLALDPDAGVPYGKEPGNATPQSIDEVYFPQAAAAAVTYSWDALRQLLFQRWLGDSSRRPQDPIIFSEEDIKPVDAQELTSMPNTLSVMFRKTAGHLVLEHISGASATQLIGRFSSFSGSVHDLCRELAELESAANPEILFADINQQGNPHTDNINRRRPIYDHELTLNVYSVAPPKMQLRPEDLLLSVRNGELVLESLSLVKRVIPRLATAYNYRSSGLALTRLLGDLQYQNTISSLDLDPEQLFPGLGFYPRLVFGRVVLSPACWVFTRTEIKDLTFGGLADFCNRHGLPAQVVLGETDQQLVFDLTDPEEGLFFINCIASLETLRLQEYFSPGRQVRCEHQPLNGQFIAFLTHDQPVVRPLTTNVRAARVNVTRQFRPGSDWLYLKLYCTMQSADRLLNEVVRPIISRYRTQLDGWFFIRYADPDHHLRLRFRLPGRDTGVLLVALQQQLRRRGLAPLVRDLQVDTYRRELERYSPALMASCEKLFEAGSEVILHELAGDRPVDALNSALYSARQIIRGLLPGTKAQADYIAQMSKHYLQEQGADKKTRISLDRSYRSLKIADDVPDDPGLAAELQKLGGMIAWKSLRTRHQLTADLVHMQMNRSFATDQRRQELLVYYYLDKYYRSLLAKEAQESSRRLTSSDLSSLS